MKPNYFLDIFSAVCLLSLPTLMAEGKQVLATNNIPNGWSVQCSVEKQKFAVGEPIVVLLVCSNQTTNQGIFIERTPLAVNVLEVKTSAGIPAEMTDYGKRKSPPFGLSNVRALPIPPNTSLTNTIDLNQTFELKKEGRYTIKANCRIINDGANKDVFIVESPPSNFEISK